MEYFLVGFVADTNRLYSNLPDYSWYWNIIILPPYSYFIFLSPSDCSAFLLRGTRDWSISLISLEDFSSFDIYFTKYRMACSSSGMICELQFFIHLCKYILQCWFICGSLILFKKWTLTPPFSISMNSIFHVHWKSNENLNQQYGLPYSVSSLRLFFCKQIGSDFLYRCKNTQFWYCSWEFLLSF